MEAKSLINVTEFCTYHYIDGSFIESLKEAGLLDIYVIEDVTFIDASQIPFAEKCIRFFYDLDINIAGIETISHLLNRINRMDTEIIELKNRLSFFD